jgi:hypothetical protein
MSGLSYSSENEIIPKPISVENMLTTDVPSGYHKITKGKLVGYKYFESCIPVQTFTQWLKTGFGNYQSYSRCTAKITVDEGSEFVRPEHERFDDYGRDYVAPSMDFRANKYHVGKIITPDGKECQSAVSPLRNMLYHPNQSYMSGLNTRTSSDCEEGLHFYPTEEILKDRTQGDRYWVHTMNKFGRVVDKNIFLH